MNKHISQGDKSQLVSHESSSDECSPPVGHQHDRFPTAEELNAFLGDEISADIDTELAVMAYERHLMRIAQHDITVLRSNRDILTIPPWTPGFTDTLTVPEWTPGSTLGRTPWFLLRDILRAIRARRVNHRALGPTARNLFNSALQKAHQAGTYQPLAAIHKNATTHRIHSMQGLVATQRFLPWHRAYLLQCENLLRTYEPSVRIPYWDYASDPVRPDWVWQPPTVTRGTPGGPLPSKQTVDGIVQNNATYTGFTFELERDAHNDVHNWCNGTITSPPTAAYDPIFWLLHANVDRIWNLWQMTHNGTPSLKAMDWILDPFAIRATDVDSVISLGYTYR